MEKIFSVLGEFDKKAGMKGLLFRLFILFCFLLAGNGTRAGSWSHYQHDNAHSGRTDDLVEPSTLALAWSAENYFRPLIVGDVLYAKRLDGLSTTVTAFSLSDGEVKWSYFGEDIYFAGIAIAGDFVVLDGFDFGDVNQDTLSVVNRRTGEFLYKLYLPFEFALADPVLVRDTQGEGVLAICNGGDYGKLVAFRLDRSGGHHLWKVRGDFTANSIPAVIEDSVVTFGVGSGTAIQRETGAQNVFFVDIPGGNGGQTGVCNAQRKDIYVKLDYSSEGVTRLWAFHYNSHDSIEPLWTRVTPIGQTGGTVAIGAEGNIYSVASNEIAVIDPSDGSTIKSVPYLDVGSNASLTRGVLWVHSFTQTFAYDSTTLALLRVFDVGPGNYGPAIPIGAFASDTAAIDTLLCTPTCAGGVSVFRSQ
jgi:hypothetical protein